MLSGIKSYIGTLEWNKVLCLTWDQLEIINMIKPGTGYWIEYMVSGLAMKHSGAC